MGLILLTPNKIGGCRTTSRAQPQGGLNGACKITRITNYSTRSWLALLSVFFAPVSPGFINSKLFGVLESKSPK